MQHFLQVLSEESRQLEFKRPEVSQDVQGKVFKDRVRDGGCGECDQLMDLLLIGWR